MCELDEIEGRILELHAEQQRLERRRYELLGQLCTKPMAYTPQQAAEALGRSTTTIWRMVQDGRLQQVEGLIPAASIEEMLTGKAAQRRKKPDKLRAVR